MSRNYIALEPIYYNGKSFAPSSPIEMEEADAAQLLELGHIKLPDGEISKADVPQGEERISAIKAAIASLNVDAVENWAKNGAPKTEAIATATGWPVGADERNAVWAEMNKPAEPAAPAEDVE